jgi:hypothetical protein
VVNPLGCGPVPAQPHRRGQGHQHCQGTESPAGAEAIVRLKDNAKAKAVYHGVEALSALDVAECIRWSLMLPDHVNIDQIQVKCRDQAAVHKLNRRA